MKAIRLIGLLTIMSFMLPRIVVAQDTEVADSTGLPGDNFSLQGAMELFKTATTLEDFEKKLNDKSNNVNNLDLNNDGKVDYVKVTDKVDKNIHAIVLRINVNAKESQDVAVIAVEKKEDNSAVAQIVGDELLYGKEVIVEPVGDGETKAAPQNEKGPFAPAVKPIFISVNVWYWPVVQYIYMPGYVVWNSPWYWGYYPPYWSPWPPYPWRYHYNQCVHYHSYNHYTYARRVNHGPVYKSQRQTSPTVSRNYQSARSNQIQSGGRQTPVQSSDKRQTEMNRTGDVPKVVSRPVEGTQGTTNRNQNQKREVSPQRTTPTVRPVERPREPARNQNQQVTPPPRQNRQAVPTQPRQNNQVSPPRSNPQPNPPVMRPQQGVKRGR